MLTTDIKYAVGIDFGHGETSFSYYNITWGKDVAGQEEQETPTIHLLDGCKTIPSIYVYDRSKDAIYIGDEAAKIYKVPIREDSDLVEILSKVDINQEIPPNLYKAVAEVFSFLYRTTKIKK